MTIENITEDAASKVNSTDSSVCRSFCSSSTNFNLTPEELYSNLEKCFKYIPTTTSETSSDAVINNNYVTKEEYQTLITELTETINGLREAQSVPVLDFELSYINSVHKINSYEISTAVPYINCCTPIGLLLLLIRNRVATRWTNRVASRESTYVDINLKHPDPLDPEDDIIKLVKGIFKELVEGLNNEQCKLFIDIISQVMTGESIYNNDFYNMPAIIKNAIKENVVTMSNCNHKEVSYMAASILTANNYTYLVGHNDNCLTDILWNATPLRKVHYIVDQKLSEGDAWKSIVAGRDDLSDKYDNVSYALLMAAYIPYIGMYVNNLILQIQEYAIQVNTGIFNSFSVSPTDLTVKGLIPILYEKATNNVASIGNGYNNIADKYIRMLYYNLNAAGYSINMSKSQIINNTNYYISYAITFNGKINAGAKP